MVENLTTTKKTFKNCSCEVDENQREFLYFYKFFIQESSKLFFLIVCITNVLVSLYKNKLKLIVFQ